MRAIDLLKRHKGILVPAEDLELAAELHDVCPYCLGAGGGYRPEDPCPRCGLTVADSFGLETVIRKVGALGALALLALLALPGCCWWAKRDCFPACPPAPVQVVQVERPCELPPPVQIPTITRQPCEAALSLSCYAPGEAAKLARVLSELKTWVKQARARCGAPVPVPASAPASLPRK
jgi:hypothetical protein